LQFSDGRLSTRKLLASSLGFIRWTFISGGVLLGSVCIDLLRSKKTQPAWNKQGEPEACAGEARARHYWVLA